MMLSHSLMAEACENLYASSTGWDDYWTIGGVVIAHQNIDDTDLLALRGSLTTEDWIRDALAVPVWHDQLGFVHAGFAEDMNEVFSTVSKAAQSKVVITGHSLGGARARILTALFAVNGRPITELCTFGAPKPGFANLARVVQKCGCTHTSYRNRNDIVPTLPMVLDWQHTEPWTLLDVAPASDNLEPLRDHAMSLYRKGVSAL